MSTPLSTSCTEEELQSRLQDGNFTHRRFAYAGNEAIQVDEWVFPSWTSNAGKIVWKRAGDCGKYHADFFSSTGDTAAVLEIQRGRVEQLFDSNDLQVQEYKAQLVDQIVNTIEYKTAKHAADSPGVN